MNKVVIIGAGPAGMGCAYTLTKAGQLSLVIEKENEPGGLCRTLNFDGYLFDIGGHRFISKSGEVNRLWHEIMGDDLLRVKRLSRIYYRKKYFRYPLSFFDTILNLGLIESFLCFTSYLEYKTIRHNHYSDTFEAWIINNFGRRLYDIFFKPYSEKVWAMACKDLSSDWARQRIKGLSLRVAIKNMFFKNNHLTPKTLSEEFFYPKRGPGEFYRRIKDSILLQGTEFLFDTTVVKINHDGRRITSLEIKIGRHGEKKDLPADYVFSSIPLPMFISLLNPAPPKEVTVAAQELKFRSLIVVNIILDKAQVFPDQWLYIHSPEVKIGRIQNYKNWSPKMVADPEKTSLGLEYFCAEGDSLWEMNNVDLINHAVKELEKIGLVSRRHLIDGFVVRCPNVYPVYSIDYIKNLDIVRNYLTGFDNFQTIGRGGLFRYDNSDHALLTGIYAAKVSLGQGNCNVWDIAPDKAYLES